MRRTLVVVTFIGVLSLAACGGGSGSGTGSSTDPTQPPAVSAPPPASGGITDPINRARAVVGQQNGQLQQEEQRTGSPDPTYP